MEDPVLLFKGTAWNSYVALTEMIDKNGHEVIVAVHIDRYHNRHRINKIASLYSKTDKYGNNKIEDYVHAQLNEGNLIDASIEKAPVWFTSRGLQLPKLVQTIIDAKRIVTQSDSNVNTESTNQITITSKRENNSYDKVPQNIQQKDASGRKLSSQQLEYFAKSVIRDGKGRLIPVYHGTKNAGFTVFNKSDDIGYFFARSKGTASTYSRSNTVFAPSKESPEFEGAAMYEVYLDIQNPLIIEGKGALWDALEEKGERVELEINCKSVEENGKCNVVVDYTRSGKNQRLKFTNSSDLYDFFATTFDSNLARALDLNLGQAVGEKGKGKITGQFPWDFNANKRGSNTKTRDVVRRAVESKNNYDGVIFKNIIDPGQWTKIKPDDVYVVFNSNQVKSVNNTEPTYDPDIRNQVDVDKYISGLFEEDKYFRSQVSKWKELSYGSFVKVGVIKPEHPLNKVGMPAGTVRYDVSKIKKNMADHMDYMTEDLLRSIPNIIANPIAITEYSKSSNTVSVFGNYFVSGSPMMVGITISKDNAGNDISKIRTFNTRRDVSKLISDNSILYLGENKKRTLEWFLACGIQVPLGGTKFGFIRSISRN